MTWLVVFLVIFLISITIFTFGGVIGGVFLLIVLNGMSESDAMPVIVSYGCLLSLFNLFITSFMGWVAAKIFSPMRIKLRRGKQLA